MKCENLDGQCAKSWCNCEQVRARKAPSALPPPKPHGLAPIYSSKPEDALVELIDGAYDIIEIWKAESPAQIAWREAWMTKARELGARPSW